MVQRLLTGLICLWLVWLVSPQTITVCAPNKDSDDIMCAKFVEVGFCDSNFILKTQQTMWLPKEFVDKLKLDPNPNPQI